MNSKPTLADLEREVADYQTTYRGTNRPPFEKGELYDLFPHTPDGASPAKLHWPNEWPNSASQGVYAILDDNLHVLYVGKASLKNVLGSRLSSYFGYDEHRACRIYHEWKGKPRYVFTVAVPPDSPFEAPALEEFLILKLNPPENVRGATRN